jgi:WD40 repeat protein
VFSVAWSPDGTRIVSGSDDDTLRIWDASTGKSLRTLTGHGSAVGSVAWSPDGRRIVSGSWDDTLRIWREPVPESILQQLCDPEAEVSAIRASIDAYLLKQD